MSPGKKRKRQQEDAAQTSSSKPPKSNNKASSSNVKRVKPSSSTTTPNDGIITTPALKSIASSKDEETSFPRGGASVLTPLEYKQVANEAMKDALFETGGEATIVSAGMKQKRVKGYRSKAKRSVPGNAGEVKEKNESGPKVEGLSYKRLVPGTLVLGCVEQVNNMDIALSLPNSLTGYIPITRISEKMTKRIEILMQDSDKEDDSAEKEDNSEDDSHEHQEQTAEDDVDLSSMYKAGQYLRAYVVHSTEEVEIKGLNGQKGTTKSKKRIELSVDPSLTNTGLTATELVAGCMLQASIESIEDHGLVMDLGFGNEVKGFLSSNELGSGWSATEVQIGQVFLCTVTGASSNSKIVQLSAQLEQKLNVKGKPPKGTWLSKAPTIDCFLPGTGVDVLVLNVGNHGGISGKIMGMLDAVADFFHVAGWDRQAQLEKRIKVGSTIKARITTSFLNSDTPKVGVSLLPHILSFTQCSETHPFIKLPISTIIEASKVVGVEPNAGLFVDIGVPKVFGFVHISRVSSEGKIENLEKVDGKYQVGSQHPARVLGFNPMDGLFNLSMEKRVLEQPYLRIEDIKVGAIVKGKIDKILDRGALIVNLADGISGIVEEDHLSDVKLKNPEKKFRVGLEVRTRVLATNRRRRVYLTLKKTLVNSEAPVISSYNIESGIQTVGTLFRFVHNGALVRFYGGVVAFLPVAEMSDAYIQNPSEHFRVGQSVNVNVLSVDSENKRIRVSCKDPNSFGEAQQKALANLNVGQVVSGKISEKSEDGAVIDLEGIDADGLKGVLSIGQLTDGSREKNMSTFRKFRAGQNLKDLVILQKNEQRRMISLSLKPSLVGAAKDSSLITCFEKVNQGNVAKGYVTHTTDVGVFVRFAGGITGLARKIAIPTELQSLPSFGYRRDQSVTGRVINIDHEQKKFLLSLKKVTDEKSTVVADTTFKAEAKEAVNPIDGHSKSVDDYCPGKITKAKIISLHETQVNVRLADNIQGRIDVTQLFDSWKDIQDKKAPVATFKKKNQTLDVKVIGLHDARNHRFLPISHRSSNKKTPIFELTAKPSALTAGVVEALTLDKVVVGSKWLAFINNIASDCVWVNISPGVRGRIRLLDLSDDVEKLKHFETNFPVGSALKCTVVKVDLEHNKLDLSAKAASVHNIDFDGLSKGMVLPGRITRVQDRQVVVQVSDSVAGFVNLMDIADDFTMAKTSNFNKNDMVRVYVLEVNAPNKRVTFSTRPSKVLDSSLLVKDPEVNSIRDVKDGELRRGFVKNVSDKGLFVSLGHNVTAWVKVSDLSDSFLKDWKANFKIDQVVEGRIVAIDHSLNHIQMSLRPSAISGRTLDKQSSLKDFSKGQIISGKIKKVMEYGVFVAIDGSNVSGLCHKSEIAERRVDDITKLYAEGDPVQAKILSLDLEKRKISFGLKASYFIDMDEASEDGDGDSDEDGGINLDKQDESMDSCDDSDDDSENGGVDFRQVHDFESENAVLDIGDDDVNPFGIHSADNSLFMSTGISGTTGFDWTGNNAFSKRPHNSDSESDSSFEGDSKKPRNKKSRKKSRLNEIKQDLTGTLLSRDPQSVTDFERLLLGDPNDSRLWIQYMAFQLQLSELEKAREIAERALKTISQRDEPEKRNVWIARLNMENEYGDDESLSDVFKQAVMFCDDMDIHERMATIYIQSGKNEKADTLFQPMIQKFSHSPKVWANYADFLLSTNKRPAARDLLKRALQSLPSYQHRDLIIKFATLEFRTGDPERGRTLFENVISAYNKHMDVWNVFLDMEMKHGGSNGEKVFGENVRSLFKRALADEKCSTKQAKFFFKKWKEFETVGGGEKNVEDVVAKARDYVAALATK